MAVNVGTIGGDGGGWDRWAHVHRGGFDSTGNLWRVLPPDVLTVSIYGVPVARLHPDGRIVARTAGHYTPSTRAALALAVSGRPYGYGCRMSTPGSRGGTPGPWRALVTYDGATTPVGNDWTELERGDM